MKARLFTGLVAAGLLLLPLSAADDSAKRKADTGNQDPEMQRAIAFEHYKDLAAERQARLEAKHPSVFYNAADREANRDDTAPGKKVIPKNPTGK
ncbi:MAG: hypothetical protein P4L56_09190 [Candidatus Sulfopaludibacter sp.]|nr:hypothetical protein [Candidatus Sulfopaludibacter sp.]